MKSGMTLKALATEVQRQVAAKRDFIADTNQLSLVPFKDNSHIDVKMKVNGHGQFGMRENAHDQIAAKLGIPKAYYGKMRTHAPDLLAENVNHWFHSEPDKRMLRTLDGDVRAYLSDKYRPLDNFDLAEQLLPVIQEHGCRIESCALTEIRLYIKAVTPRLTAEVKVGDPVQAGITISNSEVGCGSVKIEPMIWRSSCSNGAIAADYSLRKFHVGRGTEISDGGAQEFFRDDTRQADDRAFWLKVRDVVTGAFRKEIFEKLVDNMRESTERKITGDPVKVAEVVQKRFSLNDAERGGILTHLIQGGDLSQYGLLNAITRMSQDVESYDRATDLERLGGQILELPKSDWRTIAEVK